MSYQAGRSRGRGRGFPDRGRGGHSPASSDSGFRGRGGDRGRGRGGFRGGRGAPPGYLPSLRCIYHALTDLLKAFMPRLAAQFRLMQDSAINHRMSFLLASRTSRSMKQTFLRALTMAQGGGRSF